MSTTIEDEWMQFLAGQSSAIGTRGSVAKKTIIDTELFGLASNDVLPDENGMNTISSSHEKEEVSDELYISTKTKVLYLNQEIDIAGVFWNIPVIDYGSPCEGVVQKQMKVVSKTEEEFQEYQHHLEGVSYYKEHIIKQINNPSARRIKFKDERKITIGINKKDIMNCRGKIKNAFYNCFAVYIRFLYEGAFKEIHVKIFNTGKLEIPGVLNVQLLETVKGLILTYIGPYILPPLTNPESPEFTGLPTTVLSFNESDKDMGVLINSNFSCGYYINREKLYSILRSEKYGIEAAYEPCSYPGVKCKYYFNNEIGFDGVQTGRINKEDRTMKLSQLHLCTFTQTISSVEKESGASAETNDIGETKKYTEVSFMIFRTGSCLIVGNCSDRVLVFIYEFIKQLLANEKDNIIVMNETPVLKNKKPKLRKKMVVMTDDYFNRNLCCHTQNNRSTMQSFLSNI